MKARNVRESDAAADDVAELAGAVRTGLPHRQDSRGEVQGKEARSRLLPLLLRAGRLR